MTAGLCAASIAVFTWAGLASEASVSRRLTRAAGLTWWRSTLFFCWYLTNQAITILACLMTTTAARLMGSRSMLDPRIYAAVVVTGIVFEALLRRLWSLTGFRFFRNALMHDLPPRSALLYWLFSHRKAI